MAANPTDVNPKETDDTPNEEQHAKVAPAPLKETPAPLLKKATPGMGGTLLNAGAAVGGAAVDAITGGPPKDPNAPAISDQDLEELTHYVCERRELTHTQTTFGKKLTPEEAYLQHSAWSEPELVIYVGDLVRWCWPDPLDTAVAPRNVVQIEKQPSKGICGGGKVAPLASDGAVVITHVQGGIRSGAPTMRGEFIHKFNETGQYWFASEVDGGGLGSVTETMIMKVTVSKRPSENAQLVRSMAGPLSTSLLVGGVTIAIAWAVGSVARMLFEQAIEDATDDNTAAVDDATALDDAAEGGSTSYIDSMQPVIDDFLNTSVPMIVIAFLVTLGFVVYMVAKYVDKILVALCTCIGPGRKLKGSVAGAGFRTEHRKNARITLFILSACVVVPMLGGWVAHTTLSNSLVRVVSYVVDQIGLITGMANDMIDSTSHMKGGLAESMAGLGEFTAMIDSYRSNGKMLAIVLARGRLIVIYVQFIIALLVAACAAAGAIFDRSRLVDFSLSMGPISIALFAFTTAFNVPLRGIFESGCGHLDTFLKNEDNANANLPDVVQLFAQCAGNAGDITLEFINADVVALLKKMSPADVYINGSMFVTGLEMSMNEGSLDGTVSFIGETLLSVARADLANATGANSTANSTELESLEAGIDAMNGAMELFECPTLRIVFRDLKNLLCEDIGSALGDIAILEGFTGAALAALLLAGSVCAFVMRNPYKPYKCPRKGCGRRFRYRFAYRAHVKVGCAQAAGPEAKRAMEARKAAKSKLNVMKNPHEHRVFREFVDAVTEARADIILANWALLILMMLQVPLLIGAFPMRSSVWWLAAGCIVASLSGVYGTRDELDRTERKMASRLSCLVVFFNLIATLVMLGEAASMIAECQGQGTKEAESAAAADDAAAIEEDDDGACTIGKQAANAQFTVFVLMETLLLLAMLFVGGLVFLFRKRVVTDGQRAAVHRMASTKARRRQNLKLAADAFEDGNDADDDGVADGADKDGDGIEDADEEIHRFRKRELGGFVVMGVGLVIMCAIGASGAYGDSTRTGYDASAKVDTADDDAASDNKTVSETVPACNGHATYCDMTFDEVTFAASHNAMSSVEEGWGAANNFYPPIDALKAGVYGLSLDLYYDYDENGNYVPYLCHGKCNVGRTNLADESQKIGKWLETQPNVVVMFILERYVSADDLETVFLSTPIGGMLHSQPFDAPWSTLQEMIDLNQRVVVFTPSRTDELVDDLDTRFDFDGDGGGDNASPSWLLPVDFYAGQNDYKANSEVDFRCDVVRGRGMVEATYWNIHGGGWAAAPYQLYLLNHFITDPIGNPAASKAANTYDSLWKHVSRCTAEQKKPNAVMVDFWSVGDLLQVVEKMNGV